MSDAISSRGVRLNPASASPVLDQFRLDGRVAVVTGGAGNLGSAICRGLTEAGATVVIASRNVERCRALASELEQKGARAEALYLDLADSESIEALAAEVVKHFGRADILVNNAVSNFPGHLEKLSTADWEAAMKIDGTGFFHITQRFISEMLKAGSGNIINISSVLGVVSPTPSLYPLGIDSFRPNYFFAKAGILNYSRFLAVVYAEQNIRVNCISPGGIETDPPRQPPPTFPNRVPMKRLADSDEFKGAAVFLASDASSYITGANLIIDGGYTAW
jgi:NAD(P)-dependent dehydrogenase (short-subunit alcohol dehydrogenase family)